MAMPNVDSDDLAKFGVMINLAWPRPAVYGNSAWYYRWGAFVFVGVLGAVGAIYYLAVQRGRGTTVLDEHRAGPVLAAAGVTDEPS